MKVALIGVVALGTFMVHSVLAQTAPGSNAQQTHPHTGGTKSLEERIKQLEAAVERPVESEKWYDRIQIGGLIEVEAGYRKIDFNAPATEDETTGDVDLATVELAVDAKIADRVDGHVLFLYEDDDVFLDEGFITLSGNETLNAYLIAGRQYIPFGYFDSHFVTDPNTLILGETNEGAAVAGYRFGGEMIDVSVGAFNGRIDKAGDDDTVDSAVVSVVVQPVEGLMLGVSYTSNLASSDALSELVTDRDNDGEIDPIDDRVGGWSAFVTWQFLERFNLIGEYVAALDEFKAGELYDPADTKERDLSAWNLELGARIIDNVELALRYGGSDDGGAEFLPETQYGAVVNWGFFDNANLALEYLHDKFEDDVKEADTLTAQLAVEF